MLMKKFLVVLFLFICIPINVHVNSTRNMIAMDMDTNRILYEKYANSEHLIASISKIMTAIVALKLADINGDVTTTETILKAYGSAILYRSKKNNKIKRYTLWTDVT